MSLGRRRLFGLSALGLGAATLEGCAIGFGPGHGKPPSVSEVEALLRELEEVVARVGGLDADPARFGVSGRGARVAEGRERCLALVKTLCFLGTFRDVPESTWREPRIEAQLARSLPRVQAVITRARDHVAELPDGVTRALDERLRREPDLPKRVMEQIEEYAKDAGVPLDQRAYLRMSTAQLTARFRYNGAKEVAGKIAASFDRLLDARIAELGLDREVRETASTEWEPGSVGASGPARSLFGAPKAKRQRELRGEAGESCRKDKDCEEDLLCSRGRCVEVADAPRSKQLMATTREVAKWGGWFMIPPGCAIGVLILLVSLFMVIVAGVLYAGED